MTVKYPACILVASLLLFACEKKEGWGVLLWAAEDGAIPSGVVLPVYVKSNIEKQWIVGVPREYRAEGMPDKIGIPLARLELVGSRGAAKKYSAEFSEYALIYAETLQDGLPVRSEPDNGAGRIYRLRIGETVKVLSKAEGTPAISATGEPLPGDWYRVLTEDGTRGYCFSYRLRLFDHGSGRINSSSSETVAEDDRMLQRVHSRTWVSEAYDEMMDTRKFDLEALEKRWNFTTGEDTGIANVYTSDIDNSFRYSSIRNIGERAWRFDGTSLTMNLLNDTMLSVQFIDNDGMSRMARFVSLPVTIDDLIAREKLRRENLYAAFYTLGPEFASSTFGKLTLTEDGDFLWQNFEMLVPEVIPVSALGRGKLEMRHNLSDELMQNYTGVASFRFKTIGSADRTVNFIYKLNKEDAGEGAVAMEYLPGDYIKNSVVRNRDESALTIYFFKTLGTEPERP